MSDDDLDWMKEPEDEDEAQGDDDLAFDWLSEDDDDEAPAGSGRTGVTGQLSWQQGTAPGDDARSDDDEMDLAWQGDDEEDDERPGSGLTGQLSWLGGVEARLEGGLGDDDDEEDELMPSSAATGDTGSLMEWMSGVDDDDEQLPEETEAAAEASTDLPGWLAGMDEADELEDEPVEDSAEWMAALQADETDDEFDEFEDQEAAFEDELAADEEDEAFDLGFGDEEAEPAYKLSFGDEEDDEGFDLGFGSEEAAPAYELSFGDEDDEGDELSFGAGDEEALEFAPDKEGAMRPTGRTDDLPDWMQDTGDLPGEGAAAAQTPTSTGGLPDWMQDTGDLPDEGPAAAQTPASTGGLPDWLDAEEEGEAEAEAVPAAAADLSGLFDDDEIGGFLQEEEAEPEEEGELEFTADFFDDDEPAEEELPDFDMLGDMTPTGELADLGEPDWLAGGLQDSGAAESDLMAEFGTDDDLADMFGFDDEEEAPAPAAAGDESFDWFSDEEKSAAGIEAPPDWMETLEPAEMDFEDEFEEFEEEETAPDIREPAVPPVADVEALLAGFEDADDLEPATRRTPVDDLETLFEQAVQRGEQRPGFPLTEDAPEWLRDMATTTDEGSVTRLVRRQADRPLDELPDRLQELHEKGMELIDTTETAAGAAAAGQTLPGVIGALIPAAVAAAAVVETAGQAGLTEEQKKRAELLRQFAGVDASPLADRLLGGPAEEAAARPRSRLRLRPERFVITLLLALAVLGPFLLPALRVGQLPPPFFAAGSPGRTVFDYMDTLAAGDLVLVALEYAPGSAAEMDPLTQALLRHALLREALPVMVSTNPVGLLRAENHMQNINTDLARADMPPLEASLDYYVLPFLPGEAIGVRQFGENPAPITRRDQYGIETGLRISSLDDFALIVVIADRGDALRIWAEQIAPLTRVPLLAAAGRSAAPLVAPYVNASTGIEGLLTGYGDAHTYNQMLTVVTGGALIPPVVLPELPEETETPEVPADTPTPVPPTPTTAPAVTDEEATPTQEVEPTPTPEGFEEEDEATPTPTLAPTATPTMPPTPTPTPEPATVLIGTVVSSGPANVRSGPGTSFPPVVVVNNGDEVFVIGESADGQWVNILLADGTEGWIAAFLLEIEEREVGRILPLPRLAAVGGRGLASAGLIVIHQADEPTPTPEGFEEEDEATPTMTPTPTVTPTPTATPTATPEPRSAFIRPQATAYSDERWYAMTLGIIAAAVVIGLGLLMNIVRAALRRGREENREP